MRLRFGNLTIDLDLARRREEAASSQLPQPMLQHRGMERFVGALDQDATYRTCIAAALALGLVAGLGFGLPFAGGDAVKAALWAAAGSCLALGNVLRRNRLGARLASVVAIIAAIAWAWWSAGRINPPSPFLVSGLLVTAAHVLLSVLSARQRTFAVLVASVALLHLGAGAWGPLDGHGWLWLQLACVALEFGLVVAAAYRRSLAALLLNPEATYRRAPVCIVPRLDRDTDYPAQITADGV